MISIFKSRRREQRRAKARVTTLDNRRSVQLHAELAERRRLAILARGKS